MDANRDVDAWTALADPTRHAIVARLAEGPQAVGQLAAGLPVTRSAVSQHLKVLKDAGLVSERAEGTRRIYRLNPAAVVLDGRAVHNYTVRQTNRGSEVTVSTTAGHHRLIVTV